MYSYMVHMYRGEVSQNKVPDYFMDKTAFLTLENPFKFWIFWQ